MVPRALPGLSLLAAVAVVAATLVAAPAQAGGYPTPRKIASRSVVFDLYNVNNTPAGCTPDRQKYQVRGRLVGPRQMVNGHGGPRRFNVLVHDAGTGGWFWTLPGHPTLNYARQLARQGETSLVIDRLGYDASPLADGRRTCLGAQATMLHEVVQKLYSGTYAYTSGPGVPPHAARVVVHGHGTGAAIAQLEAAHWDDTHGLVLMSWSAGDASPTAAAESRRQAAACRRGGYAPFGVDDAAYRSLLFAAAPAAVQRAASARRNPTPCGDVSTLAATTLATAYGAGKVKVPTLRLLGARDALVRGRAAQGGKGFARGTSVTTRVVAGAGSALPLEPSAPATRAAVLAWLRSR
ncbi:hypothetical protein [Nocardioides sp. SYSU D00038]|uniref:hypothetical protein n=1 Tax=Nocardioides sp. SYSU D00038 TaxID=2812554 RepID=UPI0019672E17|nr:hypothetical protein [Nocardioides sp. SYSU D00038]